MKETVSLIGPKNKFLPRITMVGQPVYVRIIFYLIYTLIWAIVVYISDTFSDRFPVAMGYLFGIAIIFLIDYIDNYGRLLFIDKNIGALVTVDKANTYMVLNEKYLKFNEKDSLWMSKEEFDRLVKQKKLDAIPLAEWITKEYTRSYGSTSVGDPTNILENNALRLLSGSYMILSLITLGVLSSNVSQKLSKKIFPFIIAGSILALAVPSIWLTNLGAVTLAIDSLFKTKSLITAVSLGICATLLFIFKKY